MSQPEVVLKAVIKTHSDEVPAGEIFYASTVTDGWLECDGSEYNPAEYPELHQALVARNSPPRKWYNIFRRKKENPPDDNRLPDFRGRVFTFSEQGIIPIEERSNS